MNDNSWSPVIGGVLVCGLLLISRLEHGPEKKLNATVFLFSNGWRGQCLFEGGIYLRAAFNTCIAEII